MAVVKIQWSQLLNLTDLEFIPEQSKLLSVSDEILQVLSWLTAATGHDRRLLRCDAAGALLTSNAWSLMSVVESDELYPSSGSPVTFTATLGNKGVVIATDQRIVKLTITRVSGGDTEVIYLPPALLYWYPHNVYSIVFAVVPDPGGGACYVGVTAYK